MTIEVAVMEAYKPDLSAGELRELEQQLDRRSASERKKVIEECKIRRYASRSTITAPTINRKLRRSRRTIWR